MRIATIGEQQLHIRGYDLHISEATSLRWKKLHRAVGKTQWSMSCKKGQVFLSSGRTRLVVRGALRLNSPSGFMNLDGKPVRGEIEIFSERGKECDLVNVVGLEKYLDSVVNSEFNSRWSPEAVAAQAVAARTYALYQILENRKRKKTLPWDLESTIQDQVYGGAGSEHHLASQSADKTKGWILSRSVNDLSPIKAFYHSTCAGRTTVPQAVWNLNYAGLRKGVPCPYCRRSPGLTWSMELSETEVLQKMQTYREAHQLEGAQLVAIHPGREELSGRRLDVTLVFRNEKGQDVEKTVTSNRFRNWMGIRDFRSTVFNVGMRSNQTGSRHFVFSGRGNGHGVGLCQWGAKVMGEKGFSMAQILSHYYPDAILKKLW